MESTRLKSRKERQLLKALTDKDWVRVEELLQEDPISNTTDLRDVISMLFTKKEWSVLDDIVQMKMFEKYTLLIAYIAFENAQWQRYLEVLTQKVSMMHLETMASLPFKTLSSEQQYVYVSELLRFSVDKCYDMALFKLLDLTLIYILQKGTTHSELAKNVVAALCDPNTKLLFYTLFYTGGKEAHIAKLSVVVSRRVLELFLRSLWSDARPACSSFAFLMAAKWEKWEVVKNMVAEAGPGKILCHGEAYTVLHTLIKLGKDKCGCAARLLQCLLSAPRLDNEACRAPLWASLDNLREIFVEARFQEDPMYDLDQFARVCEDLGLHGAASLVTLWGLAEEETLPYNAKVFLREGIDSNSAEILLKELIDLRQWNLVLSFLKRLTEHETFVLTRVASRIYKGTGAKAVVKTLINNCKDARVLQFLLFNIVGRAVDPSLFQLVLAKNLFTPTFVTLTPKRPDLAPTLTTITHAYIQCRKNDADTKPSDPQCRNTKKAYAILRTCIEAGFSTQLDSSGVTTPSQFSHPLSQAAYAGMVDLVNLLYQTGATCSAEMRRLMTRPQIGVYDIVGDADSEVLAGVHRYLEDVVSRPRRLLDLCRLELSRIIGCRADRKERALSLGLPLELTRVVLFYDVLDTCTVL
ncbi:hypothetical protein BaRGS_00017064 [Batillaria attramentaria]|uniref:Uncharacterized protein n=1 Tax=Batillaria attramentaria TaxID=370345 RepID=A0ABD0KX26_9CAEN